MTGQVDSGPEARLRGWKLAAARVVTLGVMILAAAIFALTAPARWQQLNVIAALNGEALKSLGLTAGALPTVVALFDAVEFAAYFLVAVVIFVRRSDDRMALFVTMMLATMATALTRPADAVQRIPPILYAPYTFVFCAGVVSICLFLYLFPNQYFVPRWTRWPARLFSILIVVWYFGLPLLGLWPFWPQRDVPLLFMLIWLAGGLSLQVYRYARLSSQAQRQQTKWVVYGLIIAAIGFSLFSIVPLLIPSIRTPGLARVVYILIGVPFLYVSLFALPLSLAFSILRYRLWDVEFIFQRTLVYGALTAGLVLVYFGCVLLLQQVFRVLLFPQLFPTPAGATSVLPIVISTIVIALIFNPLRQRAQAMIDRRLYRRKYDAAQTLGRFSLAARNEVDLDKLTSELTAVVQEAMQPEHVSVWLKKRLK